MPIASPLEVQAVKDAILLNPNNFGVGIWHRPSDQIIVDSFDNLQIPGHVGLVLARGFQRGDCRGFIVVLQRGRWTAVNLSELNGPMGEPGALRMPAAEFAAIDQALRTAGL